jgi:integrase
MPKVAKELGALAVQRLTAPGLHAVGGVAGLLIQVKETGARTWILRVRVGGKRRDMGLGGFPTVTLAMARERAREARLAINQGVDPVEDRLSARKAAAAATQSEITFDEAARKFIEAKRHEWKNDKHQAQWSSTLEQHAFPVIGQMRVREIQLSHVLKILEPIWTTKTETASRLRGRIESVLDWATVRHYREGLNPARWKGHLDKALAAPNKVVRKQHFAALPWARVPAFMSELRARDGIAARALEFGILCASRSGEIRGARWAEINLDAGLWVIPAERMKAEKEHRVPLSPAAINLLREAPRFADSELVFPSPRGKELSDMTLTAVLRRMNLDVTQHGFRSSFRDWAAEATNYPREVAEMALAHSIGDKVEAAYRRGDLFEKRRAMMADWAAYCSQSVKILPSEDHKATFLK